MQKLIFSLSGIWPALIFGDTLVLDRWLWLRRRLPMVSGARLIDVGCGSGTFSLAASRRGYHVTGVSMDEGQNQKARNRAAWIGSDHAEFHDLDIRRLDEGQGLLGQFDVAICTETIEHILDDAKLMRDIADCLKPGGRLLLTAPYVGYKAITPDDNGPFSTVENGGHVRRGYREEDYRRLCEQAGLEAGEIGFCSGFLSQMLTKILRYVSSIHYLAGWILILPLRLFAPIIDPMPRGLGLWPDYSITLVARKSGESVRRDEATTQGQREGPHG